MHTFDGYFRWGFIKAIPKFDQPSRSSQLQATSFKLQDLMHTFNWYFRCGFIKAIPKFDQPSRSSQLKTRSNLPAFLRTFFTGPCTFLAMLTVMMLATFVSAFFAEVGTKAADLFGFFTSQTHQLGCCITGSRTFHIKLDAFGHHLYIFLLCTGTGAMVANGRALETGFNAGLVSMVSTHKKDFNTGYLPQKSNREF